MIEAEDFEKFYKEITQFDDYLGVEISVLAPGEVVCALEIKKHHLAAPDACHGGVISALMDSTLGITALSWAASKGNLCSTVEFKLNYISPARPGDRVKGTAKIDFAGSKLIVTSGRIVEGETGRVIAMGMGTFSQFPISKKADQIYGLEA